MNKHKSNFALCISGPSASGKTNFCTRLINSLDSDHFDKIYWILGDPNALPANLQKPVEFIVGVPEEFENIDRKPVLYVLDDSMFETQNKSVANLFTRGCHHQNISVIFITQNLFHQGKYARDISLNFSHICLMKNPRDKQQFQYLARQLYPENWRELLRLYKSVTESPYSYLFIDLNQNTHDLLRFRTDIFNPDYCVVICPAQLPNFINGKAVENEACGEGRAFSAYFKKMQL